jgi:diguanylate cyclase (GGDEF)-like protein/PAS domain S-box-containing protein
MQKLFEYERVKYLYNAVPVIIGIHFISMLLFALIMWQYVDNYTLVVWVITMVVVILFRIYHYILYSNTSEEELQQNSRVWLHRYYTYILIGGGLWGSTALLLFPQGELLYQMVVVLFILGLTATALGIISASWYLVIAYALLSFAPLIIRLSWMQDPIYQTLAYIVTVLGILMIFTAKHFGGVIDAVIQNKQALSQTMDELANEKNRFSLLLDNAPIGIFYYDQELRITDLNKRLESILQLDHRESLIGYDLNTVADRRILPALQNIIDKKEGHYEGPFYSSIAERSMYIELRTVPITDTNENVTGAICFFKDLTTEMEAKEAIEQNAFYDPLTKLPNRVLFSDRILLAIEQSKRHRFRCAVLFIDLDHFKQVNDNLGHYIGDQLLYKVSQRLLERVRSEDTVARIGGDEFLVLLNGLSYDEEEAERVAIDVANDLINAVRGEYRVEEHDIIISASIGVHIFSGQSGENPATIIKYADIAMYQAKRTGRNRAERYHEDFENTQQELLAMEKELRRALDEEEFEVYYQPKVSVKTKRIEQVEALIRWDHPERGLLMPDQFIAFAEACGLILRIGEWVMQQSMRQMKRWQNDGAALSIKSVAINVSTPQFEQPDFVDNVKKLIEKTKVSPSSIEFELTESVMLDNSLGAIDKIRELEEFGIHIALDDFGTGYSSLSYLKHLPISIIKIDRSFISDLKYSQNSFMIVKTIISIAKNLNLTVIAEGVETEEELKILQELDCDYYQGFLCEKAVPAPELETLLESDLTVYTHKKD